jgi:hypothetical protein
MSYYSKSEQARYGDDPDSIKNPADQPKTPTTFTVNVDYREDGNLTGNHQEVVSQLSEAIQSVTGVEPTRLVIAGSEPGVELVTVVAKEQLSDFQAKMETFKQVGVSYRVNQ